MGCPLTLGKIAIDAREQYDVLRPAKKDTRASNQASCSLSQADGVIQRGMIQRARRAVGRMKA